MEKRALAVAWFILAGLTLYFVVADPYPNVVVALTAWAGGVMTPSMYRMVRDKDFR